MRNPLSFMAALAACLFLAAGASAHDMPPAKAGTVVLSAPFARASATPVAKTGAIYLTLTNEGSGDDRLVGAATPAAAKAELHTHVMKDGAMRMRPVESLEIPVGETVPVKPGGTHIMLMGLKAPLEEGGTVDLTLTFERGGDVTIAVPVLGVAATADDLHSH